MTAETALDLTRSPIRGRHAGSGRAIALETIGMTKRFGSLTALDDVSVRVRAGTVHALLGENGAGKSTLVKCIVGYYRQDSGDILIDEREVTVTNPRDSHALGLGMVYQHFTLVPNMTVAENLVMSRPDVPAVVNWRAETKELEDFLARMPFKVPLDTLAADLSAGEKQKVEILKQLYLDRRFLILDEPTSVLTPQEADEMLGLLRDMAHAGDLTILMITHKFREVLAFCDDVSVLRQGKLAGAGHVSDMTPESMAAMMIGDREIAQSANRVDTATGEARIEIRSLSALDGAGHPALTGVDLTVNAGEIVGIAGVSGNGQSELVEVIAGQRAATGGEIRIAGEPYSATRAEMARVGLNCLPEEPLRNAVVGRMSVAENLAFRSFDVPPFARGGWWLDGRAMRRSAVERIAEYRVKTTSPDAAIETLSGGNVQRAVLARELSDRVNVLIVANPCFGLDFSAVAEIRGRIMNARNRGVAVLLVSEDLDEILELADRIVVISGGRLTYETAANDADIAVIGRHMAGH